MNRSTTYAADSAIKHTSGEARTAHRVQRKSRAARAAGLAVGISTLLALAPLHAAGSASSPAGSASTGTSDRVLAFDKSQFTQINVTIDGVQVPVRWYKEVCYVANPVAMASVQKGLIGNSSTISNTQCGYQSMNIFVPVSVANSQDNAIYFAVNNAGWWASYITASVTNGASFDSATSNVGAALKAGYVYVDVATRGRGVVAADGTYAGKAPAAVVDAKAAVRYLRLNDALMPGSAERIVVNGTSGGGGLSSVLGASGNSSEYYSYLAAIGAAGIDRQGHSTLRDDVFAVNAYCPISDLGHADIAYEWVYNVLGTRATVGTNPNPEGSKELAAKFPSYEQGLRLRNTDGKQLTAATMLATIKQEVAKSAEIYMKAGNTLPNLGEAFTFTAAGPGGATASYTNDWLTVDNAAKKVVTINIERYLAFVATQQALKSVPGFDQVGLSAYPTSNTESTLFGTSTQSYSNFTEYTWNHNDVQGDGIGYADTGLTWSQFVSLPSTIVDNQVKLVDPLQFIGTGATTAPYWYIRHGTRDRDTAFTVSINLSRALAADQSVQDVNYHLAWNQPHAGNYDVPEAMKWIAEVLKAGGKKGLE
jgi:hypothetical protein